MSYLDALFSLNGKVAFVTGSKRGYVDGGITSVV
jgi:hypothetical protein